MKNNSILLSLIILSSFMVFNINNIFSMKKSKTESVNAEKAQNNKKIKKTVSFRIDVNKQHKYGYTELIKAIINNGGFYYIKLLLDDKADVNIQDDNGNTALIWAVKCKNIDIARLLIKYNANIDIANNENCTALIAAINNYDLDIMKLLVNSDMDFDIQNKYLNIYFESADKKAILKNILALFLQMVSNNDY